MTATEILNLSTREIDKMTGPELRAAAAKVFKAANQRMRRVEASKVESRAVDYAKAHGGKFSSKGLTTNQLRAEMTRAKSFMQAKTSTIKGSRAETARLTEIYGVKLTTKQANKYWEVYGKLKELHPEILYKNGSYSTEEAKNLQQKISDDLTKHPYAGVDGRIKRISKMLDQEYQETEKYYNESTEEGDEILW